jgi:hypothetical protein
VLPLSTVGEPWWDAVAIIGCGASLTGFDFRRFNIPGIRILAVKEAVWDLPFADAVFGLDRPWINRQADKLRELRGPEIWLAPTGAEQGNHIASIEDAKYLRLRRFEGLSDDPGIIQSGGNSGFGAVNLAYLKRAKRIVLFGFDYTEANGHHYRPEQYHWYRAGQNARYWKNWGDNFRSCLPQLKRNGVEVINASPVSTVDAFPKVTIAEGLEYLSRLGA